MARQKVPPSDVKPLDPDGRWIKDYYDLMKQLDSLDPLSDIVNPSFTVPTITPGSTSYTPTTGVSKTSTTTPTGVVQTFLFWTSTMTLQQYADNFATIADALTKAATNHTNIQTAVSALNTRTTALENKIDAVIADLAARFP